VRAAVASIDPEIPVYDVKTMQQRLDESLAQARMRSALLAVFSGVALVLASLGLYGMITCAVAERRQEIGIRMALGGSARDVIRLILQQGVGMVMVGLGVGVLAALGITRVMTGLLVGVSPSDPLTYTTVALLLAAVALLACWIPARRATRVDPGVALRYE
jgi:ABC-type antimicrobial peptide transport system permease subunit